MRTLLAVGLLVVSLASSAIAEDDPLPRKPFLGVKMEFRGQPPGVQLVVTEAIAGTTAAAIGIQAGDVLVDVDGQSTTAGPGIAGAMAKKKVGETVVVRVRRGDETKTLEGPLLELPRESSPDYETRYGSVVSNGVRLRTILTKPKAPGRLPAVLIVQGLGPAMVEAPADPTMPYRWMADRLTREGFVTLRVQKPGVGDSEGGPQSAVDFLTETAGFAQGLEWLRGLEFVDPERLFLFGHSMGGIMAPLLDAKVPLRGHVVFGTTAKTWLEYMLENVRRQMVLEGTSHGDVDSFVRKLASVLDAVYARGVSLKDATANEPEVAAELGTDLQYGKTVEFFRQIARANLAKAWEAVKGDVLAIWGEADFVTSADDHRVIADIVEKARPGHGRFLALARTDHGFRVRASQREAFDAGRSRPPVPAPLNDELLRVVVTWLKERSGPAAPK